MTIDTSYVAAWPDAYSCTLLELAGVTKRVHLTTCFDKSGRLADAVAPPTWRGAGSGRIVALEEWVTRKGRHVVALLDDCPWAHQINGHYVDALQLGKQRFRPHITLAKRVEPGAARQFHFLVGQLIRFDRHGFE